MKNNIKIIISLFVLISLVNVSLSLYNEKFRPQLHYSPPKGWMNDPNGLVYHKETYNLFFQHYPNGTNAGPMHWGHAVSKDLLHWTTLPIALYPNEHEFIWSGSAIMDYNNVTGFQTSKDNTTMIAIFTAHGRTDNVEKQNLAYSNDNGIKWTFNPKNPIIDNPKIRDFRDPKVFRYQNSHYVIVLAAGDHVRFYKSADMKHWSLVGEFGQNPAQGSHSGVWECPDLFPINVDINGKSTEKWVLTVSTGPLTQYFIGSFNGEKYTNDNPANTILWVDYGPDSYAGVTFNSAPNNRTVFISWMNRWEYAGNVPTDPWRGQTSIPRSLNLIMNSDKKLMLSSMPVPEINSVFVRSFAAIHNSSQVLHANSIIDINSLVKIQAKLLDIKMTLDITGIDSHDVFGLHFGKNKLSVFFNSSDNKYYIDRSNAGRHDFSDKFALKVSAPRLTANKMMDLRLIVDVSSVELFADNGLTVMTSLYFPNEDFNSIINLFLESKSKTSQIKVHELIVNELKSVW